MSKAGRSDRIGGRAWKLRSGGGDDVAHSSVPPPQGSSPAGAPRDHETTRFHIVRAMPRASTPAPAVDVRLSSGHPGSGRYVTTRRGIPRRPTRNSGLNVMLYPTNVSQNESMPRRSLSRRPVILGNQKYSAARRANMLPPASV